MTQEQIFLMCLGGVMAGLGYGIAVLFVQARPDRLKQRLQENKSSQPVRASGSGAGAVSSILGQIGRTAGKPFEPKTREEQSALRRQLGYAGMYSISAVHLMSGAKAISLAAGLLGGYFLGVYLDKTMLGLGIGGLAGYLIPGLWLSTRIGAHQKALEYGLPDALDLMVVCVEAGLTIDAAMQRVGREINLAHPAMARELAITHLESQMGVPRSEALRNLSRRTGSSSLKSLTAMLIQAERFGTGIAQALRIHAESLRIKRQYAAEERAAKASIKMTFPLVVCIFPAMLIVIGGPAIIKLMHSNFMQ